MANLYEQTNTLQYIRDMLFLDRVDETTKKTPLDKKLSKLPQNSSFVDDRHKTPSKRAKTTGKNSGK